MAENHDPVIADGETPEVAEQTAGASAEGGCPVVHGRVHPTQGDANSQWWPNRLNLKILAKHQAV
jgi:catalase-peroxidase